jgi:beta-lactamase superfamily II metal-dependent hydrolase
MLLKNSGVLAVLATARDTDPSMPGAIDYLKADRAPLYAESTGSKQRMYLLWGDRVEVLDDSGARVKVRARGRENYGWVEKAALGGDPLLELYFIDVGQGDGILIKTPNGRHLMVDGGLRRSKQDTGKSAADFVDWKFFKDYAEDRIVLDALIASHCDADHYGGLTDLLEVDEIGELDCEDVRVKAIYHAGIGWWKGPKGKPWLGPYEKVDGDDFFTQLVGDREAIEAALAADADPALHGEWADFLRAALGARSTSNRSTPIRRLSSADGYLPGFDSDGEDEPAIKVLAPVHFELDDEAAVRRFSGGDSKNTNGNSLLLALKFGACRILLTGDLNRASQEALLADYSGRRDEFLCDVGKACHHGSQDVSFAFLKAMSPAVTVFSSGDNEGYDHPRPAIVSASAISGYTEMNGDELVSPLIYSTEVARSVKIDRVGGARQVTGLVYGLVNVRTDGRRILCATRDEKSLDWQIAVTRSRF